MWRILLFLLLGSATMAMGSLVPLPGIAGGSLPLLLGALVGGWVLLAVDERGPGALGFHFGPSAPGEALLGLGLGVGVALPVVLGVVALGGLAWVAEPGSGSWIPTGLWYLRVGGNALLLLAIPAAAEEALFRGYLFQALAEGWGPGRALWVTAILFGALHVWNPSVNAVALGNIVVAGLFLGVVYVKTASLWWATGAHLGWNWAQGFLADLPISGLELVDSPLLEPHVRGASWLSGGAFGLEGSVVMTIVVASAALVLWKASWLRPGEDAKKAGPLILGRVGVADPLRQDDEVVEPDDLGRRT